MSASGDLEEGLAGAWAGPALDQTIHAGCVVVGEAGILIRGPSGVGKSTLARQLIAAAQSLGQFARLVSDDRTRLLVSHGRLLARPVPAIAGRIEVRGVGLLAVPNEPAAVIRLVVDGLVQAGARLPEPEETSTTLLGVDLPRLALPIDTGLAQIVLLHLSELGRERLNSPAGAGVALEG